MPWWQSLGGDDPHLGAHSRYALVDGHLANEAHVTFTVDMRGVMGESAGTNSVGLDLKRTEAGRRVSGEGSV